MKKIFQLTTIILIFCCILFEMATDIFAPSLPEITKSLFTTESMVQKTLSIYLFGLSVVGVLSGPLSDTFGRKPIFIFGVAIFTSGTFMCGVSQTIDVLILSRFIQGLGAGTAFVLGAPILKDLFDEKSLSRVYSVMGMVITLSPMVAPLFGAFISEIWDWRMNFFIITVLAFLAMILLFTRFEETLPIHARKSFSFSSVFKTYLELICTKKVMLYILISGVTYGVLWAWVPEAPFYFIEKLGLSKIQYAYLSAIGPASYIIGTIINQTYVLRYGTQNLLKFGLFMKCTGAVLLLISTLLFGKNLFVIYTALGIWCVGMAPVFANATAKAMNVKIHTRGSASALLNATETLLASCSAYLVSQFSDGTIVIPAIIIVCGCVLNLFLFFVFLIEAPKYE